MIEIKRGLDRIEWDTGHYMSSWEGAPNSVLTGNRWWRSAIRKHLNSTQSL